MGLVLNLPLSHNAPIFAARHPHYDCAFSLLAEAVSLALPDVRVIDVGANVGDTAAVVLERTSARVLCVEGNQDFLPFLRANLAPWPERWELEETLVGERQGPLLAAMISRGGTAGLSRAAEDNGVWLTTLDRVVEQHRSFRDSSLVKIDTDGFDGAVLAGACELLARAQPILFFEYHPALWRQLGGHDETVFAALRSAGYESALLYANTGQLLSEVQLSATEILADLRYFLLGGTGVEYLDVAAFPRRHLELATHFVATERERFRRSTEVTSGS